MSEGYEILSIQLQKGKSMMKKIKELLGIRPKSTRDTYIPPTQCRTQSPTTADTIMNQGDFHSGSAGYSPNTAYPDTQYGSGFDEVAEWNEGDWR
jgi:hypothetical protein